MVNKLLQTELPVQRVYNKSGAFIGKFGSRFTGVQI